MDKEDEQEHQPREHAVICTICLKKETFNLTAVCDACTPTVNRMNAERRVRSET